SFARGTSLEFKVNRGTWATVEKDTFGTEVSNRTFTVSGASTVPVLIASWADSQHGSATGTIQNLGTVTSQYVDSRTVLVYLPAGYATSGDHRYPVLYMHDGQNLFNAGTSFGGVEWQVDEHANALLNVGAMEPTIIVGIYNTAARMDDYTPVVDSQ